MFFSVSDVARTSYMNVYLSLLIFDMFQLPVTQKHSGELTLSHPVYFGKYLMHEVV